MLTSLVVLAALAAQSPDIKVDQAGYLSDGPKIAFVVSKAPAQTFALRRATGDGAVVFEGKLSASVDDADSGDSVRAADFTSFDEPGRYVVEVPGVGRSFEFAIGPDVFARPFYLAMRSFYGQRCGTAVDLGPEFPGYAHAACHANGSYHASSGRTGALPRNAGGWHDAGDYGRYVVNSGLTTGTLLWTYELFGERVAKVKLDIPESGNDVPDILDEIRWNLDWMLSMQDEDGGAFHKQTSEGFCGFVMPEKDPLTSYVIGTGQAPFKSSCATADLAAVMAVAARVYRPFDKAYSDKALLAAKRAFSWVQAHPDVLYRNPTGVTTGAYGDRDCSDERLWAAAELHRTTGEEDYHRYFLAQYGAHRRSVRAAGPQSWPAVAPMGLWTYVLGKGKDETATAAIRQDTLAAAEEIVARSARNGYRISMTPPDYVWGSNGVAANYGVQLLVADALKKDARFVAAALDNLHYLLGRNAFSLSWVTQVGANPFRHPHHRPSGADEEPEPWPGLLSGGPNRSKQDPAMQKLGEVPPARMYLDEEASYATNENAINWNAALVFLLAGSLQAK
jgi:endoglucanase